MWSLSRGLQPKQAISFFLSLRRSYDDYDEKRNSQCQLNYRLPSQRIEENAGQFEKTRAMLECQQQLT